jgi:hypothetical protein
MMVVLSYVLLAAGGLVALGELDRNDLLVHSEAEDQPDPCDRWCPGFPRLRGSFWNPLGEATQWCIARSAASNSWLLDIFALLPQGRTQRAGAGAGARHGAGRDRAVLAGRRGRWDSAGYRDLGSRL